MVLKNLLNKRVLSWTILLVLLTGLIYFLFFTRVGVMLTHSNMHQLSENVKSLGIYGQIIGVLMVFLQTFFPFIPFVVVAGTNVAIFGFKDGFIVNYITSVLSAVSFFYAARYYGHAWVTRKLQRFPFLIPFSKRMETHGFLYVLLGRFIPVLPSSAINLAAGVTGTRFGAFLAATVIGKLPIIYLESLIAHDLFHFRKYKDRLLLLLLIFALLIFLGHWFQKKLSSKSEDDKK
ncbi:TVP38/TMEM64 family protein [Paenibacillus sp. GP183]|jgi:uncharacterized membrane protein YdjX (TVP38/TMEM64 family)|uniref:TVP38/TMEM64 family protein n=1 Tax=Paenibacillus sp. GP183 TaxID=1882751 RepID=UPI00089D4883|nr:TVP38/TMEM64 family protein [Paenibacillus sp. GP183]SEB43899.1 Uncharacterized membrane protein YdjX, TVP38/TMEM64 family, SNARE-associated domain [Paenibacillus sp. GP183]